MKRNNKKGFTITELVIVIAVIAILAAVLIPTFSGAIDKAKRSAADQEAAVALKNMITNDDDATLEGTWYFVHKEGYVYLYVAGKLEFKGEITDQNPVLPNAVDANDIVYSNKAGGNAIVDLAAGTVVKVVADLPASVEVINVIAG